MKDYVKRFSMPAGALVGVRVFIPPWLGANVLILIVSEHTAQ
jgi:hypothetical protein